MTSDDTQLNLFAEPKNMRLPDNDTKLKKILGDIEARKYRFTSKEEYYESPEWGHKRRQKLEQAKYRCEKCGSPGRLDVHHLTYDRLYDEDLGDLQVVCRSCHRVADGDREYDSALDTYAYKKYGEDACSLDQHDLAEEFDEWRRREGDDEW